MFLYYRDPAGSTTAGSTPAGSTVYASFGAAEKKLLAVVDGVAFVVQHESGSDAIAGYDVHDGASIPTSGQVAATAMNVTLEGATDELEGYRALAHDAQQLVVTDTTGRLFVVPLGSTEPVQPLLVVQQGEAPACE